MPNMAAAQSKTYKIGQAARILELEPYVLRFWESEFPQLDPIRTPKGQRLYSEEHLALLRRIKHLLYTQGLTIEGAKRKLQENSKWWDLMQELQKELQEIRSMLQD
ncbi:MAG: MerR family transcriptional regulator [Desulfohalobiaceae bacterium]